MDGVVWGGWLWMGWCGWGSVGRVVVDGIIVKRRNK